MIQVKNISKSYKLGKISGSTFFKGIASLFDKSYRQENEFAALDDVSFTVPAGQKLGIIGTNGAGKSTLLKILSRITAPTSGVAQINGRVSSMLEVGTGFHGELTGRENIYLNGAILGMTRKEIDSKINEIISFSECGQFIDTPVKRYSSGMYVKLAFSVAAYLDSEVLIMDEVLAVGDVGFQTKCINKMALLSKTQNRTILYVSHNMNTIRNLCDRCIVLNKGKLIFDGDVENAIDCYSNLSSSHDIVRNYDDYLRNDTQTNYKALIKKAGFLNLSDNVIELGSKLNIFINVHFNEKIENIYIRCILSKLDKTPVGISMSQEIAGCRDSFDKKIEFELDTSFIAPGKYSLMLILFKPDHFGNQEKFDMIENALDFEVISTKGQLYNWEWKSNWGTILIPEIRILNMEDMKGAE